MILGGKKLNQLFRNGTWKSNYEPKRLKIGPNSIDVSLSNITLESDTLEIFKTDSDVLNNFQIIWTDYIHLSKNKLQLGSVNEWFDCSEPVLIHGQWRYFAPMYEGRSSLGRLGLFSHVSAGFGDYGFKAPFTLELLYMGNHDSLRLPVNTYVGQVSFIEVFEPEVYVGPYGDAKGAMGCDLKRLDKKG